MKKRTTSKRILLTAAMLLILFSCKDSFLDVKPTGAISVDQLKSKKGVEGALIAAYSMISGSGTRMVHPWNWVWGSIRGGDANKGTDPGDFSDINPIQTYGYLATQGVIHDNYRGLYEIVSRANNVLRLMLEKPADITDADAKRITGEARFIRAHAYFSLKRNFNNTPYVDETLDYGTGIDAVANDADLWPKIEADMKYAYDNLPETQGSIGRANKWAAAAYLGKIYLYQKKYTEAKAMFDAVIANGVTTGGKKYALEEKYGDLFKASNDNNAESIFAVQAAANTGSVNNANSDGDLNYPYNTGPNGPGNCCGFFQPSFELGNSFRTKDGLPLLDGSYNVGANQLKTDMGVKSVDSFTPDAGEVDPRLDWSIGRRGIMFLDWQPHPGADWIRNQPNGGPYTPKKYTYYKSDKGSLQDNSSWTPGYTALNYTVIRFADVLLMAAECEIEVGSLEKAREYVNMIRKRAANKDAYVMTEDGSAPAANYVIKTYALPWTDKDAARSAVRFERKLELSGEGHRFYDLVRWGTDIATLNSYLDYEKKFLPNTFAGASYKAINALLPIPQAQIDLVGSSVLKQNPGYN